MLRSQRSAISDPQRANAAATPKLQDSALLAAIVESSDDAIIGKTLDGIITSWNKGAQRIFGYASEEIIGEHISRLIPPGREEEEPRIQERLRIGERVDQFDTVRVAKSGQLVDVSVTISPICDSTGRIVGASKIARDITQQKRAAEQTRLRDAELAHLSRVSTMGNIAAGLAHELGQPLGAIMNYAGVCMNLARTSPPPTEKFVAALGEVMNEARRAGAIISRLREFVRKQTPRCAPVNVNELVRKSIALLNFELRHANIKFDLRLAAELPLALADDIQVEQVLVNLIYNAMQAMEEMPVSQRNLIIQTEVPADAFVQVSVIDSGKGMCKEDFDRLFEPFFTTKPQGLGIGLNISRSIVASHGGRMLAKLNPAGGMRFTFALPQAPLAQNAGEKP